jgi:hypothetical protein
MVMPTFFSWLSDNSLDLFMIPHSLAINVWEYSSVSASKIHLIGVDSYR